MQIACKRLATQERPLECSWIDKLKVDAEDHTR